MTGKSDKSVQNIKPAEQKRGLTESQNPGVGKLSCPNPQQMTSIS